jgi:predicted PurR-regulated permease PerM
MEGAVVGYVKGQVLISLIIGTSAGVGMWVLGVTGALPGADGYAFLFGLWAGLTELIPYLGPILGAVPPAIYALFVHPVAIIWVVLLFLFIHQVEGHIVVPNVMGNALRLHPLLVIFGLLAGAEIYGLPGIFVALPVLAAGRAAWEFFSERIELQPWEEGAAVPVEVDLERAPQPATVVLERVEPAAEEPPEPPAAASR